MKDDQEIKKLVRKILDLSKEVLYESFENSKNLSGEELEEFNKNLFDYMHNGLFQFAKVLAENVNTQNGENIK